MLDFSKYAAAAAYSEKNNSLFQINKMLATSYGKDKITYSPLTATLGDIIKDAAYLNSTKANIFADALSKSAMYAPYEKSLAIQNMFNEQALSKTFIGKQFEFNSLSDIISNQAKISTALHKSEKFHAFSDLSTSIASMQSTLGNLSSKINGY